MYAYRKGSRAEQELINFFLQKNYSVIRAAGSGAGTHCPDLLLFKKGNQYAIESKAHEKEYLNLSKEQFLALQEWENNTGITSYIAWRRDRAEWLFIALSLFDEKKKSFGISWKRAELVGRKQEELI